MIRCTVKIQQLDVPNLNNHIYPTSVVAQAIAGLDKVCGTIGMPWQSYSTPGAEISHMVTNLRIEDGYLVGDITTVPTPEGDRLGEILSEVELDFRLAGTCSIVVDPSTGWTIISDDYKIHSINAVVDGA